MVAAMSQELLFYYAANNGMLREHHGITMEGNAVLLTMLNHANSKTHLVNVGRPRLADSTSLHGRSIDRAIEQLISSDAIVQLPKVKYGRTWVNAYRPNLFGMPKRTNDACADADANADACAHDDADGSADACALEDSDVSAQGRDRENELTQHGRPFAFRGGVLQPEPEPKLKPEIEKNTLEEKFGHVINLAVKRSLRTIPPTKTIGEPLRIKKRKEMVSQLLLIEDSLDGLFLKGSPRSEALAELVQCLSDGAEVDPRTKAIIYPVSSVKFPSPFKPIG
jgi:hypothetical protein